MLADDYFSSTEYTASTEIPGSLSHAWRFNFAIGDQNFNSKVTPDWAIAVRSGRAVVPEPSTAILFGFGLLVVGATFRKRAAA